MSKPRKFRQSNWLIGLSPRKNVEPRIVGIRSTFRCSTFFRLLEIRLNPTIRGSTFFPRRHSISLDIFPPSGDPPLG